MASACSTPQCTDFKCRRFGHTRDDHKDSCYQCGSLKHKADACMEQRCKHCQLWGHDRKVCPFLWLESSAKAEATKLVREGELRVVHDAGGAGFT
jgi:hypothetical protein